MGKAPAGREGSDLATAMMKAGALDVLSPGFSSLLDIVPYRLDVPNGIVSAGDAAAASASHSSLENGLVAREARHAVISRSGGESIFSCTCNGHSFRLS